MAQYCRYCEFLVRDIKEMKCAKNGKRVSVKRAKHTNSCKVFQLNPVDAMRINIKGYLPTGIKPVELGGFGKQIKLDEILKEAKKEEANNEEGGSG